jgi:hypothetical protein
MGAGLLVAFTASLCCITPVFATLAGIGGIASTFSWMESVRPYLIGITVLVLGFAWYQKLKPRTKEGIECACEPSRSEGGEDERRSFWQSKKFLGIVTVFAVVMLVFPHYFGVFSWQQFCKDHHCEGKRCGRSQSHHQRHDLYRL